MAKLAIRGHATRGEEVMEMLKMLGGRNPHNYSAVCGSLCFYIGKENSIIYYDWVNCCEDEDLLVFTLEEFLEKFPYKVGDKVQHNGATSLGSVYVIEQMKWEDNQVKYVICDLYLENNKCTVMSKDLQQYKEETMEKEISGSIIDRFICLEGYDFYDDKGNILDTKEITMKKKQPKYPKTFEECCEVLCIEEDLWFVYEDIDANHINPACISNYRMRRLDLYHNLEKLIICRDAYWKIAGDWKPDFNNGEEKFVIANYYGKLCTAISLSRNRVLVFPTEEMRDAFYENFKDLIEECKELL